MIPFLAKAASTASKAGKSKKTLMTTGGVLLGVAVLGFAWYRLKKHREDVNYVQTEKKLGDGSAEGHAVQLASMAYTAMKGWGTNEQSLFNVAKKIHQTKNVNFGLVANAFRKLYNAELLKMINNELNSSELRYFNSCLNGKS